MEGGHTVPTAFFLFIFLSATLIQVRPSALPLLVFPIHPRLTSIVFHVITPLHTHTHYTSQVCSLLCVADWMVHWLWQKGKDPDSYSIPYLTALADLLGTALLSLAFLLLWWMGEPSSTPFEWF